MKIDDKSVVTFHYTLSGSEGEQLETSRGGEPTAYLHGAGNIIPGLESALAGREAGEAFSVEVSPAEGYGLRNADQQRRVPTKHLIYKGKLTPGKAVQLNTQDGPRPVTVVKAGRHSVTIDANHPLAGATLCFDLDIVDVREASAEEISHGHAHGPGGHHH